MVSQSAKTFGMIVAAIKNLRELKGSTSREILQYLSSVYNLPPTVARRQTQTALKRGVRYGILKKNGGHYILPTSSEMKLQEIAEQEINLLDACRKNRAQQLIRCKCPRKSRRKKKKRTFCRCKSKKSRRRRRRSGCRPKRRKRRKCRCGGLKSRGDRDRMKRPMTPQPFEKFPRERSYDEPLETYDSGASERSSLSNVSSMAD